MQCPREHWSLPAHNTTEMQLQREQLDLAGVQVLPASVSDRYRPEELSDIWYCRSQRLSSSRVRSQPVCCTPTLHGTSAAPAASCSRHAAFQHLRCWLLLLLSAALRMGCAGVVCASDAQPSRPSLPTQAAGCATWRIWRVHAWRPGPTADRSGAERRHSLHTGAVHAADCRIGQAASAECGQPSINARGQPVHCTGRARTESALTQPGLPAAGRLLRSHRRRSAGQPLPFCDGQRR